MSLTTGQHLFSRGWRYIVASIDNLFGKALGSATHRLGRRGGEESFLFRGSADLSEIHFIERREWRRSQFSTARLTPQNLTLSNKTKPNNPG